MTQLTTHFTLEEFTRSDWASRHNVDNSVPHDLMQHAQTTAVMLEDIRTYLSRLAGKNIPISLSSGYRSKPVNDAAGSHDTSDHLQAMAADIKAPAFGTPYEVAMALKDQTESLGIGQLIYEFRAWVHVSCNLDVKPINRVITINADGTHVGIVE